MTTDRKIKKTSRDKDYRKLSHELIEKIAGFVAAGNYNKVACALAGVPESDFYYWLNQADVDSEAGLTEADSLPLELLKSLKSAEGNREQAMIERLIAGAMPGERKRVIKTDAEGNQTTEVHETGGDWLAAATFLERRHPDRWGRKERQQITIDEHKHVTITQVEVIKDYGPAGQVIEGESRELPEGQEQNQE